MKISSDQFGATALLLRLGMRTIDLQWRRGPDRQSLEVAVGEPASMGDALAAALDELVPRRRLFAPFVGIAIAGGWTRTAPLSFVDLPRGRRDRQELIRKRFLKEARLEDGSWQIGFSDLGRRNGRAIVLCSAVERPLLDGITAALADRGLHADLIMPDVALAHRLLAADGEGPLAGMVDLHHDCASIVLYDEGGLIRHVGRVLDVTGDGKTYLQRVEARLRRYLLSGSEAGETRPFAVLDLAEGGERLVRSLQSFACGVLDLSQRLPDTGTRSGPRPLGVLQFLT